MEQLVELLIFLPILYLMAVEEQEVKNTNNCNQNNFSCLSSMQVILVSNSCLYYVLTTHI